MMKPGRLLNWLVLVASLATFAAHAAPPKVDKAKWPKRLTIATGPASGFGFPLGSAWAATVGHKVGIPISVEATTGIQVNPLMIEDDKAQVALSAGDTSYVSWHGADWTQGKKIQNQRAIVVLDPWVMQIYTTRSTGITKLSQLTGKTVNPSRRRSWSDNVMRTMAAVLHLRPSHFSNVGPGDANALLGDGRLDVAAVAGAIPHPAVSQFEVNHNMVMIGMTESEQKAFLAKEKDLMAYTIPANSYKGQTKPIRTVASYNMFIVPKSLPDDLVYQLLQATFGEKAQLAAANKSFARMEAKNIVYATIPLHPGAVEYYEAHGVKIPARLMPPGMK